MPSDSKRNNKVRQPFRVEDGRSRRKKRAKRKVNDRHSLKNTLTAVGEKKKTDDDGHDNDDDDETEERKR